jgi:arylsulfatase B
VRLTSHDWITTGSTPWNQSHIRKALTGKGNTGFWNVKVVEAGEYEIRLRRWPEEADVAINAPVDPGAPVPGVDAYRTTPGKAINPSKASVKIGDVSATSDVPPGAKEVKFTLSLKAGKTKMSALFESADGASHGAYYAYVSKK